MELTKEALQLLISTGQAAQRPERIDVEDPRRIYYTVQGTPQPFDVPAPVRDSRLNSLADLIEACQELSGSTHAVVWHAPRGVVVILDDDDRRDRLTFSLTFSEPFVRLSELAETPEALDQRGFVRLLRRDLGVDAPTVAPFRRLEWSTVKAAIGETAPGRDRLGRDIQAKVAGAAELPEDLLVTVPVYRECGERGEYAVRCAIDIEPLEERIYFRPLPGEIDTAIDLAQASIHDRLEAGLGTDVPVFYGTP